MSFMLYLSMAPSSPVLLVSEESKHTVILSQDIYNFAFYPKPKIMMEYKENIVKEQVSCHKPFAYNLILPVRLIFDST